MRKWGTLVAVMALVGSACAASTGVRPVNPDLPTTPATTVETDDGESDGTPIGRVIDPSNDPTAPVIVAPPPTTPEPPATTVPTGESTPVEPEPTLGGIRGPFIVRATGDVNLDPDFIPALADNGYEHAWSGLGGIFLEDDLSIINLACAASDLGTAEAKQYTSRCDLNALPAMADAGIDVANLGNNHGRDFGATALLESRINLENVGIAPVGAGRDDFEASTPAYFVIDGWTIAVLGFGGVVPHEGWIAGPDNPGMADGDDIPTMVAAVAAAEEHADLVIVTIHWGAEQDTGPHPGDVERAHAMIDAGADMIFGHHPHRIQPLEWYRDRPIAWSLGRFVWPSQSDGSAETAIAEVTVAADGTFDARLIPVYIESHGHPVLRD